MFYNINTKKEVRRSNWVKMATTDLVIAHMNAMCEVKGEAPMDLLDDAHAEEVAPKRDAPSAAHGKSSAEPEGPGIEPEEPSPAPEQSSEESSPTFESSEQSDEADPTDETASSQEEQSAQEPAQVRRGSARIAAGVRRPARYAFHTSVKKALRESKPDAYKAITSELKQLFDDKKALVPVKRSDLTQEELSKVIRSVMFLKNKFDANGVFEKIKARLVADGRMQDKSAYKDIAAPTVSMQSLLMSLTIAAKEGAQMSKVDIGGAYLNAEMTGETMIMELDPTVSSIAVKRQPELKAYLEKGKLLVRLDKALYGCVQSAKLWHDKLTEVLENMGFTRNEVDPCVMTKMHNGAKCIINIFVDDILVLSKSKETHEWFARALEAEFDDVKFEMSNDLSYLGMRIQLANGECRLSMASYTKDLVAEYCANGKTPAVCETPASAELFTCKAGEELEKAEKKRFDTIVAKLLYLAKRVRPDILTAVSFLKTRVKTPTKEDEKKLNRVIGYLTTTPEKELVLKCKGEPRVTAYVDASYGCHLDGKSQTGATIFIGQGCVYAASKKQTLVTKDSTEAELVGVSDLLVTIEQCDEFIRSLGYKDVRPPLVLQDNTSTISLVTKGGGKPRNKYLRVRQYLVKDRVDDREIEVRYVRTNKMLADVMTKPLKEEDFKWHIDRIMGSAADHYSVNRGASGRQAK
jgi:hypothetical protein